MSMGAYIDISSFFFFCQLLDQRTIFTPEYKLVVPYAAHTDVAEQCLKRWVHMPLRGILCECVCVCVCVCVCEPV